MATYHHSLEDTPKVLTSVIKSTLNLNVSFPNFLWMVLTNPAPSLLCAHLLLNSFNMSGWNYLIDLPMRRKCKSNQRYGTSDLGSDVLLLLAQVFGRQGAPRHRNSTTTRISCARTDTPPERTTLNGAAQPEGPGNYLSPTTGIAAPTAAAAIPPT